MPDIREPIEQLFTTFNIIVKSTPTPVAPSIDKNSYIQSFILCNPSVNTASVFWGDSQVTSSIVGAIGTGVELLTGTSQVFKIDQIRQLYEVQDPQILTAQKLLCEPLNPNLIPVIVWDMSQVFVVATAAAAPVTITACIFRNVYI
jgi:hypothetical protein